MSDEPRLGEGSFFDRLHYQDVDESGGVPQPPQRPAESASRRTRFRAWRRARPFWGGLLCLLGGLEIAVIPLTAYRIILVSHSVALAAVVGAVIAILGLLLWMTPSHNKLYGLVALVLALASFVTSNVGGFLLGGLLALVGGALGFAWDVLPPERQEPAAP
ncbi:MAG: DUF6114 domain-containing protein [Nocardioidaceae bacterium]